MTGRGQASAEVVVEHEHGLHLRPAARLVRLAARFSSRVEVVNVTGGADRSADARSLLAVTALGVDSGHVVRLTATGEDADAAIAALAGLIRSGFADPAGP